MKSSPWQDRPHLSRHVRKNSLAADLLGMDGHFPQNAAGMIFPP
jgi:hypothetical protein